MYTIVSISETARLSLRGAAAKIFDILVVTKKRKGDCH
jgi:hypothetical protein